MKNLFLLLGLGVLLLAACERHPASQLTNSDRGSGPAKEETPKPSVTPEGSPTATPRTYFPKSS